MDKKTGQKSGSREEKKTKPAQSVNKKDKKNTKSPSVEDKAKKPPSVNNKKDKKPSSVDEKKAKKVTSGSDKKEAKDKREPALQPAPKTPEGHQRPAAAVRQIYSDPVLAAKVDVAAKPKVPGGEAAQVKVLLGAVGVRLKPPRMPIEGKVANVATKDNEQPAPVAAPPAQAPRPNMMVTNARPTGSGKKPTKPSESAAPAAVRQRMPPGMADMGMGKEAAQAPEAMQPEADQCKAVVQPQLAQAPALVTNIKSLMPPAVRQSMPPPAERANKSPEMLEPAPGTSDQCKAAVLQNLHKKAPEGQPKEFEKHKKEEPDEDARHSNEKASGSDEKQHEPQHEYEFLSDPKAGHNARKHGPRAVNSNPETVSHSYENIALAPLPHVLHRAAKTPKRSGRHVHTHDKAPRPNTKSPRKRTAPRKGCEEKKK